MKKSILVAASVLAVFAGNAYAQGMGGGGGGMGGGGERPTFESLDTDGNGSVSKEEVMAFSPDRADAIMANIDGNGDGTVTAEEFAAGGAAGGGMGGGMGGEMGGEMGG